MIRNVISTPHFVTICFAMVTVNGLCFPLHSAEPAPKLQVEYRGQTLQGRVALHNARFCWFEQPDGRLDFLTMSEVQHYKVLSSSFSPLSVRQMADQLRQVAGRGREVATSGPYVVIARQGLATPVAQALHQVYRELVVYCGARHLKLAAPQFPLIATVWENREAFDEACQAEKVPVRSTLRGFYSRLSNRVMLYEELGHPIDDTVMHEAVHQIAFNCGLHSRTGQTPTWILEGLATSLESPEMRRSGSGTTTAERLNHSRLTWFRERQNTRPAGWLNELVASNKPFQARPLDAYAEAWATTFYLLERRPIDLRKYLTALEQPQWDQETPAPEERLATFCRSFGKDLQLLEKAIERDLAAFR